MSGSGISWAICKSAPRSRQITTSTPHHSVFYRPDALPAAQPTASKHWRPPNIGCSPTYCSPTITTTTLNPFNNLFSGTTWVIWYHKSNASLDINEARDDGVLGWQWHQLDHMQTICKSLQTDNHTNSPTPHHSIFTGRMHFLTPNQQRQSTAAKIAITFWTLFTCRSTYARQHPPINN